MERIILKFIKDILSEGGKYSLSRVIILPLGIVCFLLGLVVVYKALTCPLELNLILPTFTLLTTITITGKALTKKTEK